MHCPWFGRRCCQSLLFLSRSVVCIQSIKRTITKLFQQWFFWGYSLTFAEDGNAYIGTLSELLYHFLIREPFSYNSWRVLWAKGSSRATNWPYSLDFVLHLPINVRSHHVSLGLNSLGVLSNLSTVSRLQSALLRSADVSDPPSFLCLFGALSFTTLSPTGHGTVTDGHLSSVALISLGELLSISPREQRRLLFLFTLDIAVDMARSVWHTNHKTPLTLYWVQLSSGSVGSGSMEVQPSLQICVLFKLVLLPTSLLPSAVSHGCSGITDLRRNGVRSVFVQVPLLALLLSHQAQVSSVRVSFLQLVHLLTYLKMSHAAAAVLFGFMAGTLCNFATQLKFLLGYDDTLDIFASHAIGGVVGNLLTGLFAQASVAGTDGITSIPGGWLDHHYIQLAYQLADSVTGMAYSFALTVRVI